jgi:hypothetical protein
MENLLWGGSCLTFRERKKLFGFCSNGIDHFSGLFTITFFPPSPAEKNVTRGQTYFLRVESLFRGKVVRLPPFLSSEAQP